MEFLPTICSSVAASIVKQLRYFPFTPHWSSSLLCAVDRPLLYDSSKSYMLVQILQTLTKLRRNVERKDRPGGSLLCAEPHPKYPEVCGKFGCE